MTPPPSLVTTLLFAATGSTAEPGSTADIAFQAESFEAASAGAGGRVFRLDRTGAYAAFEDPIQAIAASAVLAGTLRCGATGDGVGMAVHTGVCIAAGEKYVGAPVNRVALLGSLAAAGQILVSGATHDHVSGRLESDRSLQDLGELRLRDFERPERVYQLCAAGLPVEFDALRPAELKTFSHNLPVPATSFVGRGKQLAELACLLHGPGSRLVTLTGPGGAGKSRLALEAAVQLLDGSEEGLWLVELAPLTEPELVARTVAATIGVREESGRPMIDTLVEAVADRHLLIILDNCEHMLGSTSRLAEALIRSCPRVVMLATSREPLAINGEQIYRVPALDFPASADIPPGELAAFEAVQLLVDRASAQRPEFALDESNARFVAQLCAELDGIPLAIELAAARLRYMSLAEVTSRLDQRFQLLTGGSRQALPRQQTLRALIDWSYDLLNQDEQIVLERLSVFAGGWKLEAAEEVVAGGAIQPSDVLGFLGALVDKSLVQADETAGRTRYRLLQTVRQYAAERLSERRHARSIDALRAAHIRYYGRLAETAAANFYGPEETSWLGRLDVEHDNLRLAMSSCLAEPEGCEPGLRLAVSLYEFWDSRGLIGEGVDRLEALLGMPAAADAGVLEAQALNATSLLQLRIGNLKQAAVRAEEALAIGQTEGDWSVQAEALGLMGWLGLQRGDLAAAISSHDGAVRLARLSPRPDLLARCLMGRACVRGERGDWQGARADYEEALATAKAAGDIRRVARILGNLAYDEVAAGELASARSHLEESLALARDACDEAHIPWISETLGWVSFVAGSHDHAADLFAAGLDGALRTGSRDLIPYALHGLAVVAGTGGYQEMACHLHGAADQMMETEERRLDSLETRLRDENLARLRRGMGSGPYATAYQQGRELSLSDAVGLARRLASDIEAGLPDGLRADSADGPLAGLSEREREIIGLIADGATDAQIAERLYLSIYTVRSHLDRIRDKTGLRRRAELARLSSQGH